MSSGGQILAADFAANVKLKASEGSSEEYGAAQPSNFIPEVFNVRPIDQMNHGLYHRETVAAQEPGDERDPGGKVEGVQARQTRYAIHKKRFYAARYDVPKEHVQYLMAGAGGNAMSALERFAMECGLGFGRLRFEHEQKFAAGFFNYGGYTSGHAKTFDNSVEQIVADPGTVLTEDGKPLFNLSNNTRAKLNGSTYYNGIASALSVTNWTTLHNRVGDTNGYTDLGQRMDTVPNLILVPVALDITARQIIEADGLAGTANNDGNNFRDYKKVVCPYLTDADAWFVGKKGAGLTWWQGGAPEVDLEYDAQRRSLVLVIQSEYGAQVSPGGWSFWGGSNFSTS